MNRRILGGRAIASLCLAFLAGCMALPAGAALRPGATAPDFTAPASLAGKTFTFSLREALAKGPVVVYFYPAAYTKGCDIEAHTFATKKTAFTAAGATIIGVSADPIARLDRFSADPDYCAGKFPVASDPDGKIAARYGVKMSPPQPGVIDVKGQDVTHGFFARTTFVLNRGGKVVAAMSSQADGLTPAQHVTDSLHVVQKLQKED
ncbi:MAG TPA: peroxiredoxin [Nevskiaceae bacterium]|nr:peroxiredoxin [Nevskiaceae bacterium]